MTSPWREAMTAVPRRLFIPDTIWKQTSTGLLPLHRTQDPDRWRELADGDRYVITQVDDGRPVGPGLAGKLVTSSASMPQLVADMLGYLDAQQGDRVLEIGTGTGWNAALLAHRLGADQVTSIEVDPDVAAHARTALSAGFGEVTVVTGDGTLGYDNITYRPYNLPDTVLTGIHRLMRSLGLVFGALDFILTDQGHQFIEINPNGQWGWIEHQTGQPISRALAAALKGTPA